MNYSHGKEEKGTKVRRQTRDKSRVSSSHKASITKPHRNPINILAFVTTESKKRKREKKRIQKRRLTISVMNVSLSKAEKRGK